MENTNPANDRMHLCEGCSELYDIATETSKDLKESGHFFCIDCWGSDDGAGDQ